MASSINVVYDVAFYEAFEEEAEQLKKFMDPTIKAYYTKRTIQEEVKATNTDGSRPISTLISIRTQSVLPLEWAPYLKGIVSRSTGYDHLLRYRSATNANHITLAYLPLYCARAVAEQAALLWMSLLRKLPKQIKCVENKTCTQLHRQFSVFERDGITGFECDQKTLLVVGVGNIGSQIVRIGKGLGMKVFGLDIVRKWDFVDYVDNFETVLPQADIIVCAMNLTSKNRGYFGGSKLDNAKHGCLFVNISRGELSPVSDLVRLLKQGVLGGVGIDVYEEEQQLATALRAGCASESSSAYVKGILELYKMDTVICTPHNAFNSAEAVTRKAQQAAQSVERFVHTGSVPWTAPAE